MMMQVVEDTRRHTAPSEYNSAMSEETMDSHDSHSSGDLHIEMATLSDDPAHEKRRPSYFRRKSTLLGQAD